jgi:predicted hydrocarbon binding protein
VTPIPKSGYTYPNLTAHLFLQELENLVGKNGVSALLNSAHLEAWIPSPPADDLERGVDFADLSSLLAALDDLYGPRGGRGLARRAGWAAFPHMMSRMESLRQLADLPSRSAPPAEKLRLALQALAEAFDRTSDQQSTVTEDEEAFLFHIQRCPMCWGRKVSDGTTCAGVAGLLDECVHWLFGGEPTHLEEIECLAFGGTACTFRVPKPAA